MLRRTRFLMTCFVFTLRAHSPRFPRVRPDRHRDLRIPRERSRAVRDRPRRPGGAEPQVSETPCRRNANWGVGQEYIWVTGGARAQFLVTAGSAGVTNSSAGATPMQLRACRSEADRRLAAYTYDQVSVQPESRQGSIATVRWSAGNAAGLCTVATTGRIVRFTMNGAGGGYGDVRPWGPRRSSPASPRAPAGRSAGSRRARACGWSARSARARAGSTTPTAPARATCGWPRGAARSSQ